MQKIQSLFTMCAAMVIALSCVVGASADDKLMIGSEAPKLDIEFWVSDNDGLFGHTTEFEEGNVYVVAFWATNNGPSFPAMLKVAGLQKKYDEKVQFICVSNQELEKIQDFLERPVQRGKERTFGDVTSTFCLTADPDRSVYKDYQEAAGYKALPSAFIVGKTGVIEWFGPLLAVDQPLAEVMEDKWDREEYKKEYENLKKQDEEFRQIRQKLNTILRPIIPKIQTGKFDEALELLDDVIQGEEGKVKEQLMLLKMQLLVRENHDGLADGLREFIEYNTQNENYGEINDMVWAIYERHAARDDIDKEVLKIGLEGSKLAAENLSENGAILDTYAHMIYVVEQDLDKAIEWQKKAIKYAEGREADLQPFLDQLLEEKKTGKKPTKPKKKKPSVEESDF